MKLLSRSTAVLGILLGGALALIASTQTWLHVTLRSDEAGDLAVAGADAVALLAPLSLAALALGLAMTVSGRALRYVFGLLAVLIGLALTVLSLRIGIDHPVDAVAAAITEATGLSGAKAIADLVSSIAVTVWPFLAAVGGALIALWGVVTLAVSHRWQAGGRRYRTGSEAARAAGTGAAGSRPHDAIDSWDDLSRGDDPTSR